MGSEAVEEVYSKALLKNSKVLATFPLPKAAASLLEGSGAQV